MDLKHPSDLFEKRETLHRVLVELIDLGPLGFNVIVEEYRRALLTVSQSENPQAA